MFASLLVLWLRLFPRLKRMSRATTNSSVYNMAATLYRQRNLKMTTRHFTSCSIARKNSPEIDVSETNKTVTLDLTLTVKAGVLVGTVANSETGDPLDANVEFRSTTDPRRSLSGSGLTNARFRVLVPSDTPVVMKVSKPGYDDWFFTRDGVITPIQLGPGETLELEIKLRKASPQSSSTR
jgi:hypothetical protein